MVRKFFASWVTALALSASALNAQDAMSRQDGTRQPTAPQPTAEGAKQIEDLEAASAQERQEADDTKRSAAMARLAAGLEHSEWALRVRAAELLAEARDRDRAAALLVEAAGRIGDELQQRRNALPKAPPEPPPPPPDSDLFAETGKSLEHLSQLVAISTKMIEEWDGAYTLAITMRRLFLGMPPDPRRQGLLALHRSFPGYDPQLLKPLLEVVDGAAILGLADMHAATSNAETQAKVACDKAKRQKPRPSPWAAKHRDAWGAREARRLQDEAGRCQVALAERQRELAAFDTEVAAFAAKSGWPAPPRNATPVVFRAWATGVAKRLSGSPAK